MASENHQSSSERLIIGITGHIGSGKTTIARYLKSALGFQYVRYSEVLAKWFNGDKEDKSQLQKIGWDVMAGGKQAELSRRLIAGIVHYPKVAVDGLRHPLDYTSLKDFFTNSFRLLYIDCNPQLRFLRLQARYPEYASFEIADSHPVEQQIAELRARADAIVRNDSTLIALQQKVDEVLLEFSKEG